MREILFRGKQTTSGEWSCGYTYSDGKKTYIAYEGKKDCIIHEVILETIGQYTGLTDKNGKMIFEGDVLRLVYNGTEHIYAVIWDNDDLGFKATNGQENYGKEFEYFGCCEELEVIGNIHDDPEMLSCTSLPDAENIS